MTSFEQTLQQFQQSAPVDVVGLANAMGLKVWTSKELGNVSGKLYKDTDRGGSSGYAILVNSNHVKTRQRFTVAHELAHFVLHKDDVGEGISENEFYRSSLSSPQETEANKLAAQILMPFALIRSVRERLGIEPDDFKRLADIFNVSEVAMQIRLGINY